MGLFAIGLVLVWVIGKSGFLGAASQPVEQGTVLSPSES
jgi:hypothetical protein